MSENVLTKLTSSKWLREALAQNPQAAKAWKALPARRKKEIIRYLVLLKSTTAQMRNLDKTIKALSGAQIRFLGRDWVEGR